MEAGKRSNYNYGILNLSWIRRKIKTQRMRGIGNVDMISGLTVNQGLKYC